MQDNFNPLQDWAFTADARFDAAERDAHLPDPEGAMPLRTHIELALLLRQWAHTHAAYYQVAPPPMDRIKNKAAALRDKLWTVMIRERVHSTHGRVYQDAPLRPTEETPHQLWQKAVGVLKAALALPIKLKKRARYESLARQLLKAEPPKFTHTAYDFSNLEGDIALLMERYPYLNYSGLYGNGYSRLRLTKEERVADYCQNRKLLASKSAEQEVHTAIKYLCAYGCPKIPHSYSLKHLVERWAEKQGPHQYISNGSAICAALLLGYTPVDTRYADLNCDFKPPKAQP